jgi:Tol biopolymer transport system component
MKTQMIEKIIHHGLVVTLMLFAGATTFAQTSALRANGKIASDRDGNREIYVMDADGNDQVRLTNNNIFDDHPTWSPDGSKIAFLSQRPSGESAIFLMNADGSGKTEITPITVPNYRNKIISWSPDGRQLAVGHVNGIDIVDADGTNRRFLTVGFDPAWSPDGSKILFALPRTIGNPGTLNTIRPNGSESRLFMAILPYGSITGYPDWSPDSTRIA